MKRYGSVIGVKPEKLEEYKKLHAAVWPAVLAMISECNIRNYSIYYKDGMLYSYYEYIGNDYEKDMQRMAATDHTGMVEAHRPLPATGREPCSRRMVGCYGRSFPYRLNSI